jgi:hypothetical protein
LQLIGTDRSNKEIAHTLGIAPETVKSHIKNVFVGLDEGAWFAFHTHTREEMCGFFVAFTRAKQRVVFSYCAVRGQRTRYLAALHAAQECGRPEYREIVTARHSSNSP